MRGHGEANQDHRGPHAVELRCQEHRNGEDGADQKRDLAVNTSMPRLIRLEEIQPPTIEPTSVSRRMDAIYLEDIPGAIEF